MKAKSCGILGAIGLVATAAPAVHSQTAAGDPVQTCAAISKRSARLACYDDAARRGVASAPATRPRDRKGKAVAEGLGSEQVRDTRPKAERPPEVTRALVRVASVSDNGTGHWRVVLSDGAVWQMTIADPHFSPPRSGEVIRIRRGAVGGYLMDVGRQSTVSVARVQ